MTNKEFVKKRYPQAWCQWEGGVWRVYPHAFGPLHTPCYGESERSAAQAWAAAATTIGRVPKRASIAKKRT